MNDINHVTITGRLTREPDFRCTANGLSVLNLDVAVNTTRGRGDDRKEETCFVDVTVFGGQAEFLQRALRKGTRVLAVGRLRDDEWKDKATGKARRHKRLYASRVDPLADCGLPSADCGMAEQRSDAAAVDAGPKQEELPDDDIPF